MLNYKTIFITVVALTLGFGLLAFFKRSKSNELVEILGSGEVVESINIKEGRDKISLVRYKCNPDGLKIHLAKKKFNTIDVGGGNKKLTNHFLNPPFDWPGDIENFNKDWVKYQLDVGVYIIIAFPGNEAEEVLYIKYDT